MKPKLELALTDLLVAGISSPTMEALKLATLARPRRRIYGDFGRKLKRLGLKPNADSWRQHAARILRRRLPYLRVYVGGHHVALHGVGPSPIPGGFGPCLARIVEVTPI